MKTAVDETSWSQSFYLPFRLPVFGGDADGGFARTVQAGFLGQGFADAEEDRLVVAQAQLHVLAVVHQGEDAHSLARRLGLAKHGVFASLKEKEEIGH